MEKGQDEQVSAGGKSEGVLKHVFGSVLYDFAIMLTVLSTIIGGVYKFARLEERVEQYKAQIEEQKKEKERIDQDLKQYAKDYLALQVSVEIVKCDLSNTQFDYVALKCTAVPKSSPSVKQP
ncbi:MAG TPA: hypothetical protein VGH73_25900 [Thermoanaerobaculia bacterium]|jgi:hypothetical protein